jgi:NAD dependent epimerase/dehydratase
MDLSSSRVLVTGADGFIGSHLVETLVAGGSRLRAFVYYNSFDSRGWLDTLPADVMEEVEVFAGDVRDPNGVRRALAEVDVVFHLAALIGIPFSYHSPDSYVDTNVKGTLNVLQAARDLGLSRVVVTSTSEVYGTARYVPIDEGHGRQGQSPYAASKIAADALADSFYRSFGLPVVVARPFNTYGPRQSTRAIIPTIITQLNSGADALHLGSLTPTRDLTYVTDTCAGIAAVGSCDDALGLEVNLGSGNETSIEDLAHLVMEIVNREVPIVCEAVRVRPALSEVDRLVCDNHLADELTGWRPTIALRDGLARTVAWFRSEHGPAIRRGYTI